VFALRVAMLLDLHLVRHLLIGISSTLNLLSLLVGKI